MLKSKGPVHFLRTGHRATACGLGAKPGRRTTDKVNRTTCGNCVQFMAAQPVLTREEIAALTEPDPPREQCRHDPFTADNTLRCESHTFDGVRLRCRVCHSTARLMRGDGRVIPNGRVDPPTEAGNG